MGTRDPEVGSGFGVADGVGGWWEQQVGDCFLFCICLFSSCVSMVVFQSNLLFLLSLRYCTYEVLAGNEWDI